MILLLKENIDKTLNPIIKETDKWELYEEAKDVIRSWEYIFDKRLSPDEYIEYIKYITDKLQI